MPNKQTVMIVEDDPNFAAILRNTFDLSEEFEVLNVWNSIDAFGIAFLNATLKQDWLPDLIVADLLSGEHVHHDSLTALLELRAEGFKFAVLLMSGLNLGAAEKIARKQGAKNFEVLSKSSKLDSKTIIDQALKSVRELN